MADTIKSRAAQAGLTGDFAGYSLRAGFVTEAYAQNSPERRSCATASLAIDVGDARHVEEGGVWNYNAARRLGL
ncbi:MAG: hypothetical protein ACRDRO_17595 [Pseudonocardiaceae bacterium]